MDMVIEETGVDLNYSIGSAMRQARNASKGIGTTKMNETEKEKLLKLGVRLENKENSMSIFVRVCEALIRQNFDFNNFMFIKNGKYKTLADMRQEYPDIDIDKVIEEAGVTLDYSMSKVEVAKKAVQGQSQTPITEEEKNQLMDWGVIVIGRRKSKLQQFKQQRDEAKTKNDQAKKLEQQVEEQLKKRGKNYEEQ